jgi:hypothetical protein
MLSQLRLNLRINNQITIGLQNCPTAHPDIYKSRVLCDDENKKQNGLRLQRRLDRIAKSKLPKYDYFGRLIVRQSSPKRRLDYHPPKLDLIQKFQQGLKHIRSATLLFILCNLLHKTLYHFSQYRLNPVKHFGNRAGQAIREAGAAMEIACGRDVRFCHCTTLTLPANTREAFECLAAYSSYAVNRLFQTLRRRYPDANYWFFVWEYQQRGALHLHIAHYHPDETEGMLIGNLLIEQWHKILCDISDNSGVWMLSDKCVGDCAIQSYYQYHTQPIRTSVAGYFAKYAAKASGAAENSYVREHSKTLSPKRYWGSSHLLKQIVQQHSHISLFDVGSSEEAEKRYQEVLSIILGEEIVYFNRYEFCKELIKRENYGFRGGYQPKTYETVIAEGYREVFYVKPESYQKLLIAIRDFDSWF